MQMDTTLPPSGLKKRGKDLWRSMIEKFEPNPAELALLHEMCSVLDEIDLLKAVLARSEPVVTGSAGQPRPHPIYAELRRHRELADRLARTLAMPSDDTDELRRY